MATRIDGALGQRRGRVLYSRGGEGRVNRTRNESNASVLDFRILHRYPDDATRTTSPLRPGDGVEAPHSLGGDLRPVAGRFEIPR